MLTKIFSVEKIREADAYTIKHEPISSADLMERAAKECFVWLAQKAKPSQAFAIFCGPGNNGGDGLVIARMLAKANYQVEVYVLNLNDKYAADFHMNLKRLKTVENCNIQFLTSKNHIIEDISPQAIIVDAMFGSGLNKNLSGFSELIVQYLNKLPNIKVAVDMPSGLFADNSTVGRGVTIFMADYTISFQFPKLAFLFPENEVFVGEWHVLDIGLSEAYIQNTDTSLYYISSTLVKSLIKPRSKFSHKGSFGHLLMIAGDAQKMGAALLSSHAALRVGAGLLTLHHPAGANHFVMAVPEIMSSPDESALAFTKVPDLSSFTHIAIGPGLGKRAQTAKALKMLIQETNSPMVFDADAINILSENKTWLSFLPKNSILTPHIGEFNRLAGEAENDFERLEKGKIFAKKHQVYLVIKGANTMIISPNSNVFFNSTGNAGMATAGTGDVLTGMIAGLLAQSYLPFDAVVIGVFLHGLSADLAVKKIGMPSLMASDIIDNIGLAYRELGIRN